jgi:hypothetical protein
MKSSSVAILVFSLISPVVGDAQEVYRSTRSLEEQQAISQIGQAEYYARMALRSLEASEKVGKAPYFNYESAREDIQKVLAEFEIYLKGDEATDLPPAVPLIVDSRYFADSIKNFLQTHKTQDGQSANSLPKKSGDSGSTVSKTPAKNPLPTPKQSAADKTSNILPPNSTAVFPPPVLTPQSGKAKRDRIEEILKKGL